MRKSRDGAPAKASNRRKMATRGGPWGEGGGATAVRQSVGETVKSGALFSLFFQPGAPIQGRMSRGPHTATGPRTGTYEELFVCGTFSTSFAPARKGKDGTEKSDAEREAREEEKQKASTQQLGFFAGKDSRPRSHARRHERAI